MEAKATHSTTLQALTALSLARGSTASIVANALCLIRADPHPAMNFAPPQIVRTAFQMAKQTLVPSGPSWDGLCPSEANQTDSWPLPTELSLEGVVKTNSCVATDGAHVYIQAGSQLVKLGTGSMGAPRGVLVASVSAPVRDGTVWLGFFGGSLYRRYSSDSPGLLTRIDTDTLQEGATLSQTEDDSLIGDLPHTLFATLDELGVIEVSDQDGESCTCAPERVPCHQSPHPALCPSVWRVRFFEVDTELGLLKCTRSNALSHEQSRISLFGKVNWDKLSVQHDLEFDKALGIVKVVSHADFVVTLTDDGDIMARGADKALFGGCFPPPRVCTILFFYATPRGLTLVFAVACQGSQWPRPQSGFA